MVDLFPAKFRSWHMASTGGMLAASLILIGISLGGIWEIFAGGAHRSHILFWLIAGMCLALTVLSIGYLSNRNFHSDALIAHDRLLGALLAGRLVAWDQDVKTGRDQCFGDLTSIFGVASGVDASIDDFYRHVHPEDRSRVSEAVLHARNNHCCYTADFRVLHADGVVRWVTATGSFRYNKQREPVRMLAIITDITDQKQSHDALLKSEDKFLKAFRAGPVAMTLTSAKDHRYLDVNETFEHYTGWTRNEVIGHTPVDLNIWVDPATRGTSVTRRLAERSIRNFEVHYRAKNGSLGVGLSSAEFIEIDGQPAILSAIVDITDRKRAEDELRLKQAELAEAQRLSHLGSWKWDHKTMQLSWSEELYRVHGLDPSSPPPPYEQLADLFTPESWERLRSAMTDSMQTGKVPDLDLEIIHPDGSRRWVSTRGCAERDSAGEIIALHGTTQDITDRKRTAEQLRQSQAQLAAIVSSAMDAIISVDEDEKIVLFNSAAEKMLNCPTSEAVGSSLHRFIPETFSSDADTPLLRFGEATTRSQRTLGKLHALRSNGDPFPIEASVSLAEADGKKLYTIIIRDITERIRSEESLRESEEKFRRVVEHIGDAVIVDNIDGRVTFANDRFLRLFGLTRDQLSSLKLEDYIAPEYRAALRDRHARRIRGEAVPTHFEYEGVRIDGRRMWLEVDVVPLLDNDGKVMGTQSAIRDITERKRAIDAVHASEQRLRQLIETSNDWVYEMDRTGTYTYASPQCRELLGYEPEEMIGKRPLDFVPPDELQRTRSKFYDALTRPAAFFGFKSTRVRKDGRLVVWETNAVPTFDNNGEFCGYRGVVRDITERDRAEKALLESEDKFRRVVENIGEALAVDNVAGEITYANDRFLELFGLRREELNHIVLEDYIAPEYLKEVRDRRDRRMRGEQAETNVEYEGMRRDGTRLWIESDVVAIRDSSGKCVGSQKILRNMTDRKRAEQALRESEERFRLVANQAPVLIWTSGTNKLCDYFNNPWLEFTGRPLDAELGYGWTEGVHPEDSERCLQTYANSFDRRESFEMQYRLRRHDGEYRWLVDKGVPRFNPDGSFAGYIGSCVDVTERKLAEEAMATIGRRLIEAHEEERTWIGRELHDDINQRLALLAVELDRWNQHDPSAEERSQQVRHAQERITQIAKDVQALSHRLHSSKLEYLGLTSAVNSFCKELSERSKVRVQFTHSDVPRNLPKEVSLCLFRVTQEALQNAVKHSGIKDFTVHLSGTRQGIELTVADAGRGFQEQEAFSRHGLGLISMRERLQLVQGEFSIRSTPGAGTTVYARVPLRVAANEPIAV